MIHQLCRANSLLVQALLAVTLLFSCHQSHATTIESIIMPGEVIEGHKKIEHECTKCHERFSKASQKQKCMDCHEEVAKDIKKRIGYHGRKRSGRAQNCSTCHTDHAGRDADIIKFDKTSFEHKYTDFPLRGEHEKVSCDSCHKPKKLYREAPRACYSCHKNDSPHKAATIGKFAKRCESCHTSNKWHLTEHKHDKSRFPRDGKHKKVPCRSCHVADKYLNTPITCISCHQSDDVHQKANGRKCQTCHSTRGWTKLDFNHAKDTKFPLRGRHKNLKCSSCHKKDPYKVKIKKACITCHKHDDSHKGRNGKKCQSCHSETAWSKHRFDHNKKTKFKLRGKHAKTACTSCHKKNVYKHKPKKDCYSCHKLDDAHNGKQGKNCKKCHNEKGWRTKVRFDHDISRFPLVGLHSIVPCEECHISGNYKEASIECNSCHKQDDDHEGKLGVDCQRCHNPNGWKIWRFEHNKQSEFKIDGAHKKVHCHSCHVTAVKKVNSTPRNCYACHRADDDHNGQFGTRCNRCHNSESFSDVRIGR